MTRWMWLFIATLSLSHLGIRGQQTSIKFDIPQAQSLWEDASILGNSTEFIHPFTLGTFTECDKLEIAKVFTSGFQFLDPFNFREVSRSNYQDSNVRVVTQSAYRKARAIRTIDTKILSAEGCVLACITEKDFVCRDCDYFKGDGGKCALYNTTGLVYLEDPNLTDPYYVGNNPASDHYILYKRGEFPTVCNDTDEYTHHYFALGWKAMEAGWYTLAQDMFNNAISLDPNFSMAYVGKILANEDMGYGLGDDRIPSYKEKLLDIPKSVDFRVKQSLQEQLLIDALISLHTAPNFSEGLKVMIKIFSSDIDTFKDYIINVVDGNAQLLDSDSYHVLQRISKDNIFALQLLAHNLNPYKNGKGRISAESELAATNAIFDFQKLEVKGAWSIYADCADIAEYYATWSIGGKLLSDQRDFLFRNTNNMNDNTLFKEDQDNIIVHRMNVTYMSKSLKRINEYERLHFFELQLALFNVAKNHLLGLIRVSKDDDDEQRQNLRYRMDANAYFSTYDYIYDKYAREIVFTADWTTPPANSSNDLALVSRAYYWTAAAVQQLNQGRQVDDILSALDTAKTTATNDIYMTLIDMYKYVVMGTAQKIDGDVDAAISSADQASKLQDKLVGADFTIDGNAESAEFRMLIPLGYQFEADMLRSIFRDEADSSVTIQSVIDAYSRAVTSPPLNTSRILRGYGESLQKRDENNPRREDEPLPGYVRAFKKLADAWKNAEVEGEFPAKTSSELAEEHYYKKPLSGCPSDFKIRSDDGGELCWGGYVIIGVAAAVVIIIIIIVGILCLRKKAKTPQKNKEKEEAFIFSGPNLSRQDSFGNDDPPMSTLYGRSPEATPYASQTLSIQRPFHGDDYTQRSNTIGGIGGTSDREFEASSAH